MSDFNARWQAVLDEAYRKMTREPDWLKVPPIDQDVEADIRAAFKASYGGRPLHVNKYAHHFPVSNEVLMDEGVIPDTRPPVKIGWRTRFRWWCSAKREQFGRWLGSKIAGVDLSDRDDW